MKRILALLFLVLITIASCKKDNPPLSSEKQLISFSFLPAENNSSFPGTINGVISHDTVRVKVPPTLPVNNLVPHVQFKGQKISPAEKLPVDFSNPVRFVITAEDGSTTSFVVIVSHLSTDKRILTFGFPTSLNTALFQNIVGVVGEDTILVNAPVGTNLTNLIPAVTFKGVSLWPYANTAENFSNPVQYTVNAEDGSQKIYTVIVTVNKSIYIGSNDGFLYALNASTGKVDWKFNINGPVCTATYADGVVYVGGVEREFFAIDAATGKLKWKFYDFAGTFTTPTVSNGRVYVSMTGTSYGGHDLYAFDALSGTLVWKKTVSGGGYGTISSPTVANGTVFVTDFNAGLNAFDAQSGALKWSVRNRGIMIANPAVVDGVVYVGGEGTVLGAYNATNGTLLWEYRDKLREYEYTPGFTAPTIVNGVVYVGAYQGMYAINAYDGSLKWKYKSLGAVYTIGTNTHPEAGIFSSPVVSNGSVYAAADDHLLYAINAQTGALTWKYENSLQVMDYAPAAAVANGVVFVNRNDEKLYALDAVDGSLKWTFTAGGLIRADPCIVDNSGNVYYSGNSGNVN